MKTPTDFIDAKGGPAKIAEETGHGAGAIALWRHRNKIPRTAWPEIMEAYADVTLAELKEMEASSGKSSEARGAA